MGMNGDFESMAEACGETPARSLTFYIDDEFDDDDREAVRLAMEVEAYDRRRATRIARLA